MLIALAFYAAAAEPGVTDLAAEADVAFELGITAYEEGDYLIALQHLLASNRLAPNKNVTYNIARAYEKLGRFPEAWRNYNDYLAVEADPTRAAAATQAIARIRGKVALLEVRSDPPGASVYVDRVDLGARGVTPLTLAVEPGSHTVIVRRAGYEEARTDTTVALGGSAAAQLAPKPILGTVRVAGDPPGATIRVDDPAGPVVATVPADVRLGPGAHTLFLDAPGFRRVTRPVDVVPNGTIDVGVGLEAVTGTLVVDAIERGALITVDGKAAGFTPSVLEVPVGPHDLVVTARGFRPVEQHLEVAEGKEVRVDANLQPLSEVTAASRVTETIEDAPASVSVITDREIRAFGYQTLYEALQGTRGLYPTYDLTYPYIGIRGYSPLGGYNYRQLMTLDGHTLNDDQLGATYYQQDLLSEMGDVERIEVVRGPGSALYGTNAVAGVINLVTRDGESVQPTHVTVSTLSPNGGVASAGVSGKLGTHGTAWVTVAGAASPGQDYDFGDAGKSQDSDGMWSGTVLGRASYDKLTVEASYNHRTKVSPSGPYESIVGDPRTHQNDSRGTLELRAEPQLAKTVRLYSRFYLDHYEFGGNYAYEENLINVGEWRGTWGGTDQRVSWTPVPTLTLTGGAEARGYALASLKICDVSDAGDTCATAKSLIVRAKPTYAVLSGYAVADWRPVNAFTLNAGARVDHFTNIGETPVNPRLTLIVRPTDRDTVKLIGATAFRSPSPYELSYGDGRAQIANPDLSPETIQEVEIEASHRLSDVLHVTASAYYDRVSHLIDTVTLEDEVFQYQNTPGSLNTAGGEVEVRRDWRQGTMFQANYSFQLTRVGSLAGGDAITNSPNHLVGVKLAVPAGPFTVANKLQYESARLTYNLDQETRPVVLWDVTVTGAVHPVGLTWGLGVRNLLAWEYGYPAGPDVAVPTLPQPGRSLFATATWHL